MVVRSCTNLGRAAASQLAWWSAKSIGSVQQCVGDTTVAWPMAASSGVRQRQHLHGDVVDCHLVEAPTVSLHCCDDAGENLSFLGTALMAPLASCPS